MDKMRLRKLVLGTMVFSWLVMINFVQGECWVCQQSPFLDEYSSKMQRAIEDIRSGLRQQSITVWERAGGINSVLFPLKYSFPQLMGVVEWWNAYLEASKAIFRDINKLDDIDKAIKEVEFSIVGTNILWNTVPQRFISKFSSSYQKLGVVKIKDISLTANWEDLLNGLWAINFINRHYRAKSALWEGYKPVLSGEDLLNLFNRALWGKMKLEIDEAAVKKLQEEYKCLVEEYGICEENSEGENVYERVKKIVDSFSEEGSDTIQRFIRAFDKLKNKLQKFSTSGWFWNKNWVNISAEMKTEWVALVDYNVMAGKQFKFTGAEVASKVFEDSQLKKVFGEARVNNLPDSMDLMRVLYSSWYGAEDSLKKEQKEVQIAIQQALRKLDFTLKTNIEHDVAIGTSWETRVYTTKIVEISVQIHKLLDIIGSKWKEDSLIQLLGTDCEMQCSNLGGKCWAD